METPSRFTFSPDGSTTVFQIPVRMKGDNYVRIEVDGVEITDRNKFDLVNNAVVFVSNTDVPNGSQLDVLVVQTDEGIANLGNTNAIDLVSQNITNINNVATNITEISALGPHVADINTVASNIGDVQNAAGNAASALASKNAAEAALDHFDDRYLGAKASAPSVDNDGDPLITGAFYWNTTEDKMFVWDGVAWAQATGAAEVSKTLVVATGGQTDFTIPTASAGSELVYINGVLVNSVDYTRPDNTTVSLVEPCVAGDEVMVIVNTLVNAGGFVQKNGDTMFGNLDVTGYVSATSVDATVVGTNSVIAPAGQYLALGANLSEDARIDSSGNLLVGKPAYTSVDTDGFTASASGAIYASDTSQAILSLNRNTTDGAIADFYKDGTTIGSIGSDSGDLVIDGTTSHAGIRFLTNYIQPRLNGTGSNGGIDLGSSASRFKDLYLSGGVYLGGTGSANYLDDYEEGVWTPVLGIFANTKGTFSTYSGTYVKIGKIIIAECVIDGTGMGFTSTTGYLQITGLPFVSNASFTGEGSWSSTSVATGLGGNAYAAAGGVSHLWVMSPSNTNTANQFSVKVIYETV